jgi:NAD(P)-dependent dehydrogenase (short-subunit alcohol dehydrogenase family)
MIYLITGSNRGLGLELVREGIRLGHIIIALCRSTSEELLELSRDKPDLLHIQHIDVSDTLSVKNAYHEITKKFSFLNGIINNAGVMLDKSPNEFKDPITDVDIEETEKTFNINVIGAIRVMKYFMPLIYQSKHDRCIVNISSAAALIRDTNPFCASYAASKSALNNYTQRQRNWLASQPDKSDIRVYLIHPGNMYTEMAQWARIGKNQILPSESAKGIWLIITRKVDVHSSTPFFDYKGILMPA